MTAMRCLRADVSSTRLSLVSVLDVTAIVIFGRVLSGSSADGN
jgi:hypothetical protein